MSALLRFSGAVERDPAVAWWFDARPGEQGSIARAWFARLRQCGRNVRELMHDGCPTVCVEDAGFARFRVRVASNEEQRRDT